MAVVNIADPIPSINLSNTQATMNTQPDGKVTANLQPCSMLLHRTYMYVGMHYQVLRNSLTLALLCSTNEEES